jgi:o-succinylbenzoate synthase
MEEVAVYSIPMTTRFRGITVREGLLFRGPAGWGEFCAFPEYDDGEAATWFAAAVEAAYEGWPEPKRDSVPVNCIVPAVAPERAAEMVRASGCATAKVKIADHPGSGGEDRERVAAVRDALGPEGFVRIDANTVWDVDTAVREIRALDKAAGGLQYVEQPCASIEDLAAVRRRVDVRIAADESIRRAADPLAVSVKEAADIAILKCLPLGGVRRALRVAESVGLPCVVSSALESSVGLAAEIALAAALPELDHACGLGTGRLLTTDVVAEEDRLIPVNGELPVLRTAPEPVRHKEVAADDERARWWRARATRMCDKVRQS